jgi:hypothetical protein
VSVPVRVLDDALAATAYATVPLPVPLLPDVIVIHETLLVAVQLQPVVVMTLALPLPPPPAMLCDVGLIA